MATRVKVIKTKEAVLAIMVTNMDFLAEHNVYFKNATFYTCFLRLVELMLFSILYFIL